jgi:hypothetical protein
MNNKTKVLVAYHKKDVLFRSDVLYPLHLGREISFEKTKDGKLSEQDYNWLINNMAGDNTGENISDKNRFLNEMTGIYWAWKNYNELGNPDYIGLNHYRRFFKINYSNLTKYFKDYDFIKLSSPAFKEGIRAEWDNCAKLNNLDPYDFERFCDLYKNIYPYDFKKFNNYINSENHGGLMNLFIMKKEDFFKYCEWIFPLLFEMEKTFDTTNRTIGMIAERLTAYYLQKLEDNGEKPLCTRLADEPPEISLRFLLSRIFNIRKKEQSGGHKHIKLTIFGVVLNIRH